jgi:hypothetical protein
MEKPSIKRVAASPVNLIERCLPKVLRGLSGGERRATVFDRTDYSSELKRGEEKR